MVNFSNYVELKYTVAMLGCMYGSTEQKANEAKLMTTTQNDRHAEYLKITQKHPSLLPVLVHGVDIEVEKSKYLARPEITFEKFAEICRQHCRGVKIGQPIFFSTNETMIDKRSRMSKIYEIHKNPDGFLHITVRPEPRIESIDRSLLPQDETGRESPTPNQEPEAESQSAPEAPQETQPKETPLESLGLP